MSDIVLEAYEIYIDDILLEPFYQKLLDFLASNCIFTVNDIKKLSDAEFNSLCSRTLYQWNELNNRIVLKFIDSLKNLRNSLHGSLYELYEDLEPDFAKIRKNNLSGLETTILILYSYGITKKDLAIYFCLDFETFKSVFSRIKDKTQLKEDYELIEFINKIYKNNDITKNIVSKYKSQVGVMSLQKNKAIFKADGSIYENLLRQSFTTEFATSRALSSDQITEISKNLKSKNPIERQNAVEQLIFNNMRLVHSVANRFKGHGVDYDDLIQEGILGLMKAIDKYDYSLGNKFSTYAVWWIRQAITRIIADKGKLIRIPSHMNETLQRVSKAQKELVQQLGREPSADELCEELGGAAAGFTPRKIVNMLKMIDEAVSIDGLILLKKEEIETGLDISNTDDDQIVDPMVALSNEIPQEVQSADDLVKQNLLKEDIDQMFRTTLEKDEEQIMRMRYGLSPYEYAHSLDEVAKKLHKPREVIRQIESKATRKLKHPSKSKKLRAYIIDK